MILLCVILVIFQKCSYQHNEGILSEIESRTEGQSRGSEESCFTDDKGSRICNHFKDERDNKTLKLHRWDPVQVGYVRELELKPGKLYKMITKSVFPPVFEIPDFLDETECNEVIKKAKESGIFSSQLHLDPDTMKKKISTREARTNILSSHFLLDYNNDGKVNVPDEIRQVATQLNFLYLKDQDISEIIDEFNIPIVEKNNEKFIEGKDFDKINIDGIIQHLHKLRESHPHHRDRFSEQTWLNIHTPNDKILNGIMKKLEKLTALHHDIIYGTEPIQVVRYGPHGHYHAHYDSQNKSSFPDFPCCHTLLNGTPSSCRLCRYATILYYLNDVIKGGETAFPVANIENFNHNEFLQRAKGDMYNLSEFCQNATLSVKPKKGTAVFWYNHKINENGLLGVLDSNSLHGGCDVLEGEKWIGNNWIPAPEMDMTSYRNIYQPIEEQPQESKPDIPQENLTKTD